MFIKSVKLRRTPGIKHKKLRTIKPKQNMKKDENIQGIRNKIKNNKKCWGKSHRDNFHPSLSPFHCAKLKENP